MNVPGVSRTRPDSCLSDFALERVLVGELIAPGERATIDQHLSSCATCRARRDELDAAPVQVLDPADGRQGAGVPSVRPARSRRLLGGLVGATALAAVVVLALRPRAPLDAGAIADGTRTKGDGLVLEVVARHADGRLERVFDRTVLRPGDAVRFQLTAPIPGHAAVLGLDATGRVSLYAPAASGAGLAVAAGTSTLPGSVVLDDAPGEERFVALLCEAMPAPAALDAAGRRALATAGGVPGRALRLDLPCRQDALTVRKEVRR